MNKTYAGLRHAIVITTKPRFVVKRTCNTEVRQGRSHRARLVRFQPDHLFKFLRKFSIKLGFVIVYDINLLSKSTN